ncbi:MAG: ribosomal protein S18-alanine N-acetyltransferase [Thermoanaerobaculia bacterium]
MSELEIEDARPADVDQIAALERASFPTPWRREYFEGELRSERRLSRVIRDRRAIVAYCFSMYFLDEMHVNKIAVAEPYRRRGLAGRLMDDVIAFARANGIKTITLEVRTTNDDAIAFYRAIGFEERYRRARYYPDGESAVVMALSLSSRA